MANLDERFWSKVDASVADGCWNWTANKNNKGYGMFRPGGIAPKQLAHRLSYAEAHGPIPRGGLILHSCDNPACVNPAHLRVGNHKENVADMDDRKRANRPVFLGVNNANAVLSDDQVVALRRDYISGTGRSDLAQRYGVSILSVSDYTSARSWRHLLGFNGAPTEAELIAAKQRKPGAKIDIAAAREIKKRLAAGETGRALAKEYGVHHATISDIRTGKTWADA